MSDVFDGGDGRGRQQPAAAPDAAPPRRSRALLITAAVLIVGFFVLTTFAAIWTDRQWFAAVDYPRSSAPCSGPGSGCSPAFAAADGRLRRAQHGARLPVPADVPDAVARAERTSSATARPSRPIRIWLLVGVSVLLGLFAGTSAVGPVAPVHAVAQRRQLRRDRPLLRPRHRLLRLRPQLAALPRRLRHGRSPWSALLVAGAGPLPLRRHPAADPARPAHRRGAGPALGPARPVRARQGRRLLARPVRPGDRLGRPDHRHDLHRRARRAAGQEHPDGHRGDLRGAVLPQRVAAHLDAARRSGWRCWC